VSERTVCVWLFSLYLAKKKKKVTVIRVLCVVFLFGCWLKYKIGKDVIACVHKHNIRIRVVCMCVSVFASLSSFGKK